MTNLTIRKSMYIVWNTACSTAECSGACSINYTKKKHIHLGKYIHAYTHVHTQYIHTHTYTYIHTHTYIHNHMHT